jgi:hypothetical protein
MWIVPKNKELLACVLDMAESNWDSNELAQYLEQSVMWRSKPSLARTWSQRLKRASWMQHLSGRILKPSQHKSFEEKYTESLAVIPASHSVLPENEKEQTTPDTFGRILRESCRQLDLFGVSSRTSLITSILDTPQFTEAYEIWVTKLRQDCLQRQSVARHINENGSLSWRTPAEQPAAIKTEKLTGGLGKRMYHKETGRLAQYGLEQQVNWPTPQHCEYKGQSQRGQNRPDDRLTNKVLGGLLDQGNPSANGKNRELWSTPKTSNVEEQMETIIARKKRLGHASSNISAEVNLYTKGKLNPDWVEQLMGLVVGWTAFDFSETE